MAQGRCSVTSARALLSAKFGHLADALQSREIRASIVAMSKKYEALGEFLDQQTGKEVSLSFDRIAGILGAKLPKSADEYDVWWSNSPVDGRHNGVWLKRGWETASVNRKARTVKFVRVSSVRAAPNSARSRQSSVAPHVLSAPLAPAPVAARNDIAIRFEWKALGAVTLDSASSLYFPPVAEVPGLYRLRITHKNRSEFYIGESQSLRGRFRNYRTGSKGQATSHRIHVLLKNALAAGARIEVDIVVDDIELRINGEVRSVDLTNKATRRMIEHSAIVATGGTDVEIANR